MTNTEIERLKALIAKWRADPDRAVESFADELEEIVGSISAMEVCEKVITMPSSSGRGGAGMRPPNSKGGGANLPPPSQTFSVGGRGPDKPRDDAARDVGGTTAAKQEDE